MTVEVFGIRHHGPGSARSMVSALDDFQPDVVLIEGPADADPLIRWAASERTRPPVALLAYAVSEPSRAAFWPLAVFSPEWQALQWGSRHGVPIRFCDLPAAITLARGRRDPPGQGIDPLARLAQAAGYDDPERWWDDVVESRRDETTIFAELIEAMAELRAELRDEMAAPTPPDGDSLIPLTEEARREAYMRQTIRAVLKQGHRRVAVVCGAWHAPVLTQPLPPASHDARLLRGLAKQKVQLSWVPWTHSRLSSASGYGAGITSPGWYAHLWSAPDHTITRWLTKVAIALRRKDLATSSAHVIEAVRLAEALAVLRGRPLAGLSEVQDATLSVLCNGSSTMLGFVTTELVVGQALGSVDPSVPTVPLEADLIKQCRTLRIQRDPAPKAYDLDLRKPTDRARSVLFHRLRVLELSWFQPAESEVANRGTFRETWQGRWRPEYAVSLVEAATWGTTVAGLVEQTAAVERCLFADLPEALEELLIALSRRSALDADVVHLMEALPPLARAQRYGNVRGTDTAALAQVSDTLVVRICAALRPALIGLGDDNAPSMRQRIDAVHQAVNLLEHGNGVAETDAAEGSLTPMDRWLDTLRGVLDVQGVPAAVAGRVLRILFDAERLSDPGARLHRALSYGAPAAQKAAWVEGFFADGALLIIHDADLRELLDRWLAELRPDDFVDVLPLIRRTFGTFTPAERRMIAERLHRTPDPGSAGGSVEADTADSGRAPGGDDMGDGTSAEPRADAAIDRELMAPALATVDLILGRGSS